MVTFVDRALVSLAQPAALRALLTGGAVGPYPRLERVADAVYDAEAVDVEAVTDVVVTAITPVVGYDGVESFAFTTSRTHPDYRFSESRGTRRRPDHAVYADLLATLSLELSVSNDPGGVESAEFAPIEDIASLADFESRFAYLNLDGFLAEHRITTVEELRTRYEYLRGEIHFHVPTRQEAAPKPASVQVELACMLFEHLDVMTALRAAKVLQGTIDENSVGRTDPLFGAAAHGAAVAVVFPQSELGAGAPAEDDIDAVCAAAGVLPLFASPP